MKIKPILVGILFLAVALSLIFIFQRVNHEEANQKASQHQILVNRESKIPEGALKMTPETDILPPVLHSSDFENPVPLTYPINTAGAEDSAFITPDGKTLYFFFTPSPNILPQKQLIDGVTGIYVSQKQNGKWSMLQRVILNNDVALDGCPFVQDATMWFCSSRKGNFRDVDLYVAEFKNGHWQNWKNAGKKLNNDYEAGEVHLSSNGHELYFHSGRAGGKGGYDLWLTRKINNRWQEPENIAVLNTPENEGWPFLTQDGKELWFTRTYKGSPAIFRSKKINNEWQEPELIISQFAAEPSLDNQGNIYFTHHYFKDNKMIESDIYVAYKK